MKNRFIQLPNALFEGALAELSSDGKLLYSLLMNRCSLSKKNNLTDAQGRIIVYFTNREVCEKLQCGHDKATKLIRELEKFKLISRHKQGLGKPDMIYVKEITESEKSAVVNAEKQECGASEIGTCESEKSAGNNTDISNTDNSYIDQFISYEEIEDDIKYIIEYDVFDDVLAIKDDKALVDEIVDLLTEAYCSQEKYVRIAKSQVPIWLFRVRISKLTAEHIKYVIKSLEKHKGKIRNMRAYLLTALYNSIDMLEADSLYGN